MRESVNIFIFAFLLGRCLMAHRRLLGADLGCVAIRAAISLLKLRQFLFNRNDFRIGRLLVVLMTSSARSDGNIGSQPPERAHARNIDMTGRAFHHMLALAAFVTEFRGLTHRQTEGHEQSGRPMAAGAVIADGFLIFPMAVEARVVTLRHGFERPDRWFKNIGRAWGGNVDERVVGDVTDRAVVVIRFLLVVCLWFEERSANEAHCFFRVATRANKGDHVLMFVVGKLDRELPFIFWFCSLAGAVRFTENEAPLFARGGAHMADRANSRTSAGERLSREKLLSMTTDAGVVIWKISHVRKVTFCRPGCRHFVTGVADQSLVLVG